MVLKIKSEEEFWLQVKIGNDDQCWEWKRDTYQGYGHVNYGGKKMSANRMAWIFTNGDIPPYDPYKNTVVIMRCSNRKCCNPKHMFLGSRADHQYKKPENTEQDFWKKVDIRGDDDCWNWKSSKSHAYGCMIYKGRMEQAHRLAYYFTYGSIPEYNSDNSKIIRHLCNNKLCCNPKHLALGSQTDNMRDMRAIRSHPTAKLCPTQVKEIKELLRVSGRTHADIAKQFGVTSGLVTQINKGHIWKDV